MADEYVGKPYEILLDEALKDESTAGPMYRYMASIAPNESAAERLRSVSYDEDRHKVIVSHLLAEYSGLAESGHHYAGPQASDGRATPDTYVGWLTLAEDIKTRDNTEYTRDRINVCLGAIGFHRVDEEEAKEWLKSKAQEVGIHVS